MNSLNIINAPGHFIARLIAKHNLYWLVRPLKSMPVFYITKNEKITGVIRLAEILNERKV